MTTGAEFRARREQAGLTQQEAAERLGVALRTIGNWERADSIPQRHRAAIEEMFDEEARLDALYPSAMVLTDRAPRSLGADQLASVVRDRRLDRGWGKEEAARRAGISSITWKRIEDGERVQDASLAKVLAALDLTEGDLEPVAGMMPVNGAALRAEHEAQMRVSDATLANARTVVNTGTKVVEQLTALSSALRDERSPHVSAVNEVLPDVLDMWFAGMRITGAIHPLRDIALRDEHIRRMTDPRIDESSSAGSVPVKDPTAVAQALVSRVESTYDAAVAALTELRVARLELAGYMQQNSFDAAVGRRALEAYGSSRPEDALIQSGRGLTDEDRTAEHERRVNELSGRREGVGQEAT